MSSTTTRKHALEYAQRGWGVLPIATGTKEPNTKVLRATYGSSAWGPLRDRRASTAEINAWFDVDPATSIGIITGAVSGGLVVADYDSTTAPAIATPTVATSRGRHLYLPRDDHSPDAEVRQWRTERRGRLRRCAAFRPSARRRVQLDHVAQGSAARTARCGLGRAHAEQSERDQEHHPK